MALTKYLLITWVYFVFVIFFLNSPCAEKANIVKKMFQGNSNLLSVDIIACESQVKCETNICLRLNHEKEEISVRGTGNVFDDLK